MPEQHFNVSHGIKVGINTIHDDVVFDPVPDTDSKYTSSAIDVSANKKAIRLTGSGATTGNQDVTFAGGNAVTLTRSGNEISIASTDTDTTYTTSVVDGTSNKKIIRLTAGGAGSGDDDITLAGGTNITLTRSGDEISIASTYTDSNTDTTYDIVATNESTNKKNINLIDSNSGVSTVTLEGINNITLSRTGNIISFASTDTTYSVSAADGGTAAKKIIRLTGTDGTNDDVTLVAGTNISLTRSSDEITITGANEADNLELVTNRGASTTNDITVASLHATGNISCAGTITYDDVTSVDSVGIITARQDLSVGGNTTINGSLTVNNGCSLGNATLATVTVTGTVDGRDIAADGTKLDSIDTNATNIPAGVICLYSGSSGSIPSGWTLCNGTNSTPDLRDRFVVGAGNNYAVGATGGSETVTLSTSQIPSHSHDQGTLVTIQSGNHQHSYTYPSGMSTFDNDEDYAAYTGTASADTSISGNHTHTISGNTGSTGGGTSHENRPPYYALCYIMKT